MKRRLRDRNIRITDKEQKIGKEVGVVEGRERGEGGGEKGGEGGLATFEVILVEFASVPGVEVLEELGYLKEEMRKGKEKKKTKQNTKQKKNRIIKQINKVKPVVIVPSGRFS